MIAGGLSEIKVSVIALENSHFFSNVRLKPQLRTLS